MNRTTIAGRKAVILPFFRLYRSGALSERVTGEDVNDWFVTMTRADRREYRADYMSWRGWFSLSSRRPE
jgi:hypothetical protein